MSSSTTMLKRLIQGRKSWHQWWGKDQSRGDKKMIMRYGRDEVEQVTRMRIRKKQGKKERVMSQMKRRSIFSEGNPMMQEYSESLEFA
ncbi:hypothetical protein FGO68_gene14827 [Halteria grandinella]|uniref:Uncharacterized protein n=1 Tax=Halteria grandinella TaxID=5974 RepID=A0A8J8NM88_HALGN|nr:hypothetical protein FGO68_gene14827 [Halteria grandinella]